jgi:hypothetical protein
MMSLFDVVGKNKFLAENVFLAAQKTNSWLPENIFLAVREKAGNVFLAAQKTNSWLPEKRFPGCQKNISRAAPKMNPWLKMFFWLPQKQIPLAENVFLAARKKI